MNIILNVRDTIVLCGSMFEYCPMQFFLNIFDCYCFKFSCGFLQNVPEIMSNTTGVTCGAGTAYPAEVLEFTTGFNGVPDVRYLVFCVVFCRSLFVLLSFFFWPLYFLFFFDLRLKPNFITVLLTFLWFPFRYVPVIFFMMLRVIDGLHLGNPVSLFLSFAVPKKSDDHDVHAACILLKVALIIRFPKQTIGIWLVLIIKP